MLLATHLYEQWLKSIEDPFNKKNTKSEKERNFIFRAPIFSRDIFTLKSVIPRNFSTLRNSKTENDSLEPLKINTHSSLTNYITLKAKFMEKCVVTFYKKQSRKIPELQSEDKSNNLARITF